MHPILYQSDILIIDSYSVFFLLAWMVGGVVFYREFRRMGWELEQMLFVMVGAIVGAVIGSYIFNVFFAGFEEVPAQIRAFDFAGKTLLGGIAGGFMGVELAKKKIGYPHSTGDAFAVAIPLGHAIGRIGCLLGGCCFGTPCTLPWAITYPEGSIAHLTQMVTGVIPETATMSLAVHPTPVYEIIFNLALFGYLWQKRGTYKVRGSSFRLYLAAYGLFRFFEEFVRGDSPFPEVGFLKAPQWLLLAAVAYFGWRYYQNELRQVKTKRGGML
jgi:prolipoprotein diacylglyceryltransferase